MHGHIRTYIHILYTHVQYTYVCILYIQQYWHHWSFSVSFLCFYFRSICVKNSNHVAKIYGKETLIIIEEFICNNVSFFSGASLGGEWMQTVKHWAKCTSKDQGSVKTGDWAKHWVKYWVKTGTLWVERPRQRHLHCPMMCCEIWVQTLPSVEWAKFLFFNIFKVGPFSFISVVSGICSLLWLVVDSRIFCIFSSMFLEFTNQRRLQSLKVILIKEKRTPLKHTK